MGNWLVNTPFGIKKTGKSEYFFHHHHDPLGILFPLDNILHLCQLVSGQAIAPADSADRQVAMKTASFWWKSVLGQSLIDESLQRPEGLFSLADSNP